MSGQAASAYVWFDTEFTSLNLDEARLLQVAVLLTDRHLRRITPRGEDLNLAIQLPDSVRVSDWVEKNIPEIVTQSRSTSAVSLEEADRILASYVDRWCGTPVKTIQKRPVMAGNSIHTDWMLARRDLPEFTGRLHYRLLDVSALKIQWLDLVGGPEFDKADVHEVARWFPEADIERLGRHDAAYDVVASAAELAFYRSHLLCAAAAKHGG